IVDVNVTFHCRVRGYGGERARKVDHTFRVVALRGPGGEYALYVTNAPSAMLPAEELRNVYRLRWEVETFFKTAKSGCALSEYSVPRPELDTPGRDNPPAVRARWT